MTAGAFLGYIVYKIFRKRFQIETNSHGNVVAYYAGTAEGGRKNQNRGVGTVGQMTVPEDFSHFMKGTYR